VLERHPLNGHKPIRDKHRAKNSLRGFTLVELLVVLGIIILLATLVSKGARAVQESSRRAKCASNLRQMAIAALSYADDHKGEFPWASRKMSGYTSFCWDFVTPKGEAPQPGVMWDGYGLNSVLQCPSYLKGNANWTGDPFTGYNYNSSFIGKVEGDPAFRKTPARLSQIKDPSRTVIFGDGHWSGGANKFMRSPQVDEMGCDFSGDSLRKSGTQGFRHNGKTNVAFVDGHVEPLAKCYEISGKEGAVSSSQFVCGFISADNTLYDLE
jgi:prepilin-type N-terminal cleavage/methylation domain